MSGIPQNRIRLLVLSGFLGSGKTTWLRHQLHSGRFRNRAVIVNEAAAAAVDDALLADLARVTVIPGGCICCSERESFLRVLRAHCDSSKPRDIVLETSGLAEPAAIVDAIRNDPLLVHRVLVEEVMVTVDAENALARLKADPLVHAQIATADVLVITKLDTLQSNEAGRLAALLKRLNPGAEIVGAVKGEEKALPDFSDIPVEDLPVLSELPAATPIVAVDIEIDPAIGWEVFSVWLSALLHARGDEIFRIKGVVRTPNGRVLLQCVQKSVLPPEILPAGAADHSFDNRLAFIGRGFDAGRLKRSLRAFCG